MRRIGALTLSLLLVLATQAFAAGLITKLQAEKKALAAVGGGTVIQAVLDTNAGKKTWSVDIAGATYEFEVWVDAHTGSILRILKQPPVQGLALITKAQAEKDALKAVGGGTVIQAVLDFNNGKKTWSVDIAGATHEYEVWVDAHTGAILNIIVQPPAALACTFISKATAQKDALAAIGGGSVIFSILERTDNPPVWSVDTVAKTHLEYEVKVNACTGKIVAIIPGG